MEEPQEAPELPAKKARHDPEAGQEDNVRGEVVHENRPDVLGTDVTNYPPSSAVHLDPVPGNQEHTNQHISGCDSDRTYAKVETCKELTAAESEYTSQIYQGNNPAVTAYDSQVAFSSLGQSAAYSTFSQTGQTYGLPPFGSCFTTSSVYTNIPTAPAVTTAPAAHQDFSSYNSLGQNQFPQYYVPPNSYLSPAPSNNETDGDNVSSPPYTIVKIEDSAPTGLPCSTAATPASVTLPDSAAQDEAARRNPPPKAKAKAKKSDSGQSTDSDLERIFLWDLDETIIIFHSLLTGSFAQKFGKDPSTVLNLGLQMEELIFELADTHLFFNDLEECDQVHVEDVSSDDNGQDLSNYNFTNDGFSGTGGAGGQSSNPAVQGGIDWMRKLAFRYRRLKEIYNGYKGNVGALLSPQKRDLLLRVRSDIETVTDSWLSTAIKSLLLIQSRGRCMNVLVTTTQLVPALAKVLLYGLGDVFPVDNIYSATKIGKESCFERIVSRFGKKVTYVVIGDGREEEFAAKQHNMPFWRISSHGDLVSLHQALELDFL
ncbi:protein phosphatase EYA3 isoform 2-T2 [Clarias gariepinus]|uniref:eyes absent homolog 3 isoform X3 n=1 Tax=Clarias gariepinus TaxID=13013 RepID=UPI00234CEEEC|nr:eyes absent homolog 3 isoform X3 [Clarias gariepinus]